MAIGRLANTEIMRLNVERRWFAHEKVLQRVVRMQNGDAARLLRLFYGVDPSVIGKPDVLVASGRPTIAAGILLARLTGAKFIYSGRITGYVTENVTLMLVHSPREAGEPRCVYAPIPTMVDPDVLGTPRRLRYARDLAGARIGLLVGGNSHSHRFSNWEWKKLVAFIVEATRELGVEWRVSTSRRTPEFAVRNLAEAYGAGKIAHFVDFGSAGLGTAGEIYSADAVVVTEESLSMLAEAMAARRPVVALKPARVEPTGVNDIVAAMVGTGGLAVLPITSVTPDQLARTLLGLRVQDLDPRDVIARAIAPALGLR